MTTAILAIILAIMVLWSAYGVHRLWIGPAVRRYRYCRGMKRLGLGAFVVCRG